MQERRGNNFRDLTGERFGNLVAMDYTIVAETKSGKTRAYWTCKCDCGTVKQVASNNLVRGRVVSCGCHRLNNSTKHGMNKERFYHIWQGMKSRTTYCGSKAFKNYGGRGIHICDRWLDFLNFKEDMNESYLEHVRKYGEKDTSIERNDNNADYSPENCKWATKIEQCSNTRKNKKIVINGESLTTSQISRKYHINYATLDYRFKHGWPLEKAILPPTLVER